MVGQHRRILDILLEAFKTMSGKREWEKVSFSLHTAASGLTKLQLASTGIDVYMGLVLKLNETTFKPVLLQTVDWAFADMPTGTPCLFLCAYIDADDIARSSSCGMPSHLLSTLH